MRHITSVKIPRGYSAHGFRLPLYHGFEKIMIDNPEPAYLRVLLDGWVYAAGETADFLKAYGRGKAIILPVRRAYHDFYIDFDWRKDMTDKIVHVHGVYA